MSLAVVAAERSRVAKSGIASGRRLIPKGGDGRSRWARRFREITRSHTAALGETVDEARRAKIESAATLQVEVEQMAVRRSRGHRVKADDIVRLNQALAVALAALGL